MSAQPLDDTLEAAPSPVRSRLRLVASGASTVSTLGFVGIIACLVAVGMVAVMLVSTTVTAQSKDLAALRKEAAELGYLSAALTTQLQQKASSASLAMRATDLGMVPNPYPAFIQLSDGKILGTPKKVSGREAPYLHRMPAPTPVVATPRVVVGQTPTPAATKPAAPATTPAATPAAADAAAQPVGQPAPTTGGQP